MERLSRAHGYARNKFKSRMASYQEKFDSADRREPYEWFAVLCYPYDLAVGYKNFGRSKLVKKEKDGRLSLF